MPKAISDQIVDGDTVAKMKDVIRSHGEADTGHLDDALVAEAMRRTGIKTKRAVVEEALRTLIQLKRQEEILALRGKLDWEGDLDQMRRA